MHSYFPAQLIVGVIPGYPLNIPFPFNFSHSVSVNSTVFADRVRLRVWWAGMRLGGWRL